MSRVWERRRQLPALIRSRWDGLQTSRVIREHRQREQQQLAQIARAEEIAEAFHETYERFAPTFGYSTRVASRTEWKDMPASNKALMIAVAHELLEQGIIR